MAQADRKLTNDAQDGAAAAGAGLVRHVRAFLSWWLSELTALLPAALHERLTGDDRRAGVMLDGNTLALSDLRGGQKRPVCRIDLSGMNPSEAGNAIGRALSRAGLSGCAIVLGLPEHMVLRRRESLPAATERRLDGILRLKLESTAPLPPGAFHWGYRVVGQEHGGHLAVDCVLVKTGPVEALAARLAELGVDLAGVFPEADLPAAPTLNLLPAHLRREREALWSPLNKGLAALAAGLAVLALVLTFHRQETALNALNAELAGLRSRAKAVLALRTEAQSQVHAVQAVRQAKTAAAPLMGILDEVSRLLPDGTWVSDFRLHGREVRLTGQSESASSLIGLIDRSPMFTNVRFGSPVVRDPRSGAERFNIQFDWAGSGHAASRVRAAGAGGSR